MTVEPVGVLPLELRAFPDDCIESIEQVDILLALRRTGQAASAHRMSDELGLRESVAQHHLERLAGRGFLGATLGGDYVLYKYDPVSPNLRRTVDLLAEYHASARTAVVHVVTDRTRRLLRDFGAAFRLRGRS